MDQLHLFRFPMLCSGMTSRIGCVHDTLVHIFALVVTRILSLLQGTMSEAFPHLIFNNFKTKIVRCLCPFVGWPCLTVHVLGLWQGERLATILKHLFPVPKADSKRVLTFSNDSDYISFRHHTFTKAVGSTQVDLKEVPSPQSSTFSVSPDSCVSLVPSTVCCPRRSDHVLKCGHIVSCLARWISLMLMMSG